MKTEPHRRFISIGIIILILTLGIFRVQVLNVIFEWVSLTVPASLIEGLERKLSYYGSSKTPSVWISHYLIYYPIYLLCHFSLIYILFYKEKKLRNYLLCGLAVLIFLLVIGKLIFGILNLRIMEEYFSFAFHKIIALPFLLLAIEGGRYIYKLVDESYSKN